ncbi:MAG TPA: archease [Thermoplasmata archaeon]|nr:archease [Thermoplasmata archaeon]
MQRRSGRRRRAARNWGSFPTTADVGIWARAREPAQLYARLGTALSALTVDLRGVRPAAERRLSAEGVDPSSLLVAYLGELLLLEQEEGFLVRSVAVELRGRPPTSLTARARGEPYDPARHRRRKEVKAVTLHRLLLDFAAGRGRVIVDI